MVCGLRNFNPRGETDVWLVVGKRVRKKGDVTKALDQGAAASCRCCSRNERASEREGLAGAWWGFRGGGGDFAGRQDAAPP
jgi:hypothetical protein